ncbi:MAG: hypothetical protein U0798_17110 [Gemmataceae bacterium]
MSLATSARADEPALAALFPSQTFAYAEIRDLTLIMDVWAGFVKGTPFEGSLKTSADRKDQQDRTDRSVSPAQLQAQTTFDQIGIFSSPEFQREVKKFKGIAVGVTGWRATGKPEFLAVIQTGESQSAGLIVRMILLSHPEFRRVASWGDIPVYQSKPPEVNIPVEGKERFAEAAKPKPESNIPTFAYRPGLFVLGSQHSDVIQVLKRFEGKGDEKITFAYSDRFRATRILQKPRSLFLFASPRTAFEKWEPLARSHPDWDESTFAGWMRFVVNPSAIPSVAANVSFGHDGWSAVCQIDADPAKSSPLLGMIGEGRDDRFSLDQTGFLWNATDRSGERLLTLADAIAKARGTVGRLPSDIVRKADADTGSAWKSTLLPAIESISFVPFKRNDPRDRSAVVIRLSNADRAAEWVRAFPGLLRAADPNDSPVSPSEETIDMIPVHSFALAQGTLSTIHLARKGNRISIALSRDVAAKAVQMDTVQTAKADKPVSFAGRFSWNQLDGDDGRKPNRLKPPVEPPATISDVLSPLPEVSFSAVRQKNAPRITIQFEQRGVDSVAIKQCLKALAKWWEMTQDKSQNGTEIPNRDPLGFR